MKERELQRKLVELLHEFQWSTMHVRPVLDANSGQWVTTTSARGWPDVTALRGPWLLVVECKGERGKLTPHQLDWLRRFLRLPCALVWVVSPHSDLSQIASWLAFPEEAARVLGWSPDPPVQGAML